MNYFQLERLPDAQRTLFRLIFCFAPLIIFVSLNFSNRSAGLDPVQFREIIQFERAMTGGLVLWATSLMVVLFALWQGHSRNILLDKGGAAWLSIHGWEGESDKLPQRGFVPVSEFIGLVIVTLWCAQQALAAVVLLPLCWSVVRSAQSWRIYAQERPWAFGSVYLLHATAIWLLETWWLAWPFEVTAIVLGEVLLIAALRQTGEEMLTKDVSIFSQKSIFGGNQSSVRRGTPNTNSKCLFPYSELGVVVDSKRLTWPLSIWTAVVMAWSIFSITASLVPMSDEINFHGEKLPAYFLVGHFGLFLIIIIGVLRMMMKSKPYLWLPRLGPLARIRMLRPVIWSWDRILLPHAINLTILAMSLQSGSSATPGGFAILAFIMVLLVLRGGVDSEEWQMTADAKLVSTLITSTHGNNPNA